MPIKLFDPLEEFERVYKRISNVEGGLNKLVDQWITFRNEYIVDKLATAVISYLVNHQIYQFKFDKILTFPNHFIFYTQTRDGRYLKVEVRNYDWIEFNHLEFPNKQSAYCDILQYIILMKEEPWADRNTLEKLENEAKEVCL